MLVGVPFTRICLGTMADAADGLKSVTSKVLPLRQNNEPAPNFEQPCGNVAVAWEKQSMGRGWKPGESGSVNHTWFTVAGFVADGVPGYSNVYKF